MRLILPIILFGAAVGLFALFTNPTYQDIKELQVQAASYDEALDKSQELRAVRDQLLAKRNTFPASSVQKLERMLPDNVDNIRLIIDINNIAARHNLALSGVELGEVGDAAQQRSATAVGASGDAIGSVTVGFSVSASYEDLLAFLADIEHSLRVVDVENLQFAAPVAGVPSYSFTIRTYWLK
jgi:Tfp pilus assembly protein PilO